VTRRSVFQIDIDRLLDPAIGRKAARSIARQAQALDEEIALGDARPRSTTANAQLGWKDSWDGINFADGRLAEAPIALCGVQGYVYAAYLGRAEPAREFGDDALAETWTTRAAGLKRQFNERFWLPDRGWYAVALDRDKSPVDACTSNIGHCLWSGIVDADKAPIVAERLLSPEMFTGWGVRTLARPWAPTTR
jgi:glycogen debranching enzyme